MRSLSLFLSLSLSLCNVSQELKRLRRKGPERRSRERYYQKIKVYLGRELINDLKLSKGDGGRGLAKPSNLTVPVQKNDGVAMAVCFSINGAMDFIASFALECCNYQLPCPFKSPFSYPFIGFSSNSLSWINIATFER